MEPAATAMGPEGGFNPGDEARPTDKCWKTLMSHLAGTIQRRVEQHEEDDIGVIKMDGEPHCD